MNEITFQDSINAYQTVRRFIDQIGGDPSNIDWDNKPNGLPENISVAWDTYLSFQNEYDKKEIDY